MSNEWGKWFFPHYFSSVVFLNGGGRLNFPKRAATQLPILHTILEPCHSPLRKECQILSSVNLGRFWVAYQWENTVEVMLCDFWGWIRRDSATLLVNSWNHDPPCRSLINLSFHPMRKPRAQVEATCRCSCQQAEVPGGSQHPPPDIWRRYLPMTSAPSYWFTPSLWVF